MTPQGILIMTVAGATSVVLISAGLSGTFLALPLITLSSLPIAIAGLGWGSLIGLCAALVATVLIMILTSFSVGITYAAILGLPIAYLAHAIGLSRLNNETQNQEWFPIGHILFHALLIGGSVYGLALIITGFDVEVMTKAVLATFSEIFNQFDTNSRQTMEQALALQVKLTPYSGSMAWLFVIWLNLWLGVKVVKKSGRLNRPSFRLIDAELPKIVVIILLVAFAISKLNPPLSYLGAAFIGTTTMALTILGFNTIHLITSRISARSLMLGLLYLSILMFGFPLLFVFVLGLADLIFKIRSRYRVTHSIQ